MKLTTIFFFLVSSVCINAQDDMSFLLEDKSDENELVLATFKTSRVVNAHSIEMVRKKELDLRISHRFGNIGGTGAGLSTFYGIDNASDIRIAFEYGFSDNFTTGIGRNKGGHYDGFLKYRIFKQTTNNKMPLTLCWLSQVGLKAYEDAAFDKNSSRRYSLVHQLILARKFNNSISLELLPTFTHRNYVISEIIDVNDKNEPRDENDLFSLGIAGRIKLSRRTALLIDYFYSFSEYRKKYTTNIAKNYTLTPFYAPMGIGFEIETGGHVFHITFTNARSIIENEYLPYTHDSWSDGHVKFGFTISRTFSFK